MTSHSVTFGVGRAYGAQHYRLFASKTKSDLYFQNITARHPHAMKSALTSRPQVAIGGLHYSTTPYWFRIEDLSGPRHRFSAEYYSVGMQPATPTNLAVHNGSSGLYLTWANADVTGYVIRVATSSDMTQGLRQFVTRDNTPQFTPYGLSPGQLYYFQVEALNESTASVPTPAVSGTPLSLEQGLRVMTFNVLKSGNDGMSEGGQHIASWSQRSQAAVHLIQQGDPDVAAIEEGGGWAGAPGGKRQVDTLVDGLGGEYNLADTEITPGQRGYFRTGVYILYKGSEYSAVGQGDHWSLGNGYYAAYQELRNRSTGAPFLFVSVHLVVGKTNALDHQRQAETQTVLDDAGSFAAARHIPVVYAGDFNSHPAGGVNYDGPGIAMRQAGAEDGFYAAQSLHNAEYDSAEGYQRRPPRTGHSIDHVYAPPGVAIQSWALVMDLHHGKFTGVMASDHNPLVCNVDFPYSTSVLDQPLA